MWRLQRKGHLPLQSASNDESRSDIRRRRIRTGSGFRNIRLLCLASALLLVLFLSGIQVGKKLASSKATSNLYANSLPLSRQREVTSSSADSAEHPDEDASKILAGNIVMDAARKTQPVTDVAVAVAATSAAAVASGTVAPVTVAIMTSHFLGKYGGEIANCTFAGAPLSCNILDRKDAQPAVRQHADALWFHIPSMSQALLQQQIAAREQRASSSNSTASWPAMVGFSMESSVYYVAMDNAGFMQQFDLTMTYRQSASVITRYFENRPSFYGAPSVSTAAKRNAVAYLNNNCSPRSKRNAIVEALMQHVTVHAYGNCLYNMQSTVGDRTRVNKTAVFAEYRFCIAMENSIAVDYVTEKLWDAFAAGCVPVYMGAPNIVADFLPAPNAAIVYDPATSSEAQLGAELQRLMKDDAAYDALQAWRYKPVNQLSKGFQRWVALSEGPSTECLLCAKVAQWRAEHNSSSSSGSNNSTAAS